ncbi:MAG TPA: hypothetical protein VNK95_08430 [Caldilineaceae bacterium]|nr:hypothetical protein [Caldilineaceae bacterium]
MREIVYRLLMGKQGDRLRHVAVLGGHTHRIARAIERLRKEFNRCAMWNGCGKLPGKRVAWRPISVGTGARPSIAGASQHRTQMALRIIVHLQNHLRW